MDDIDILRIFFEDVSRIPIIAGQSDYLPLTRRIRRYEFYNDLPGEAYQAKFTALRQELEASITEFSTQCRRLEKPLLDLRLLAQEINGFLDDVGASCVSSLEVCFVSNQQEDETERIAFEDMGWRCFYLLSLLPVSLCYEYPEIHYSQVIAEHFQKIVEEAETSRQRLIEGNLRYVINVARSFINQGVPYIDLLQEGFLGLMRATTGFQERNGHFQHYAASWIWQHITRYIADSSRLIRVPVHLNDEIKRFQREYDAFIDTHNHIPDELEIYQIAGWIASEDIEQLQIRKNLLIQKTEVEEDDRICEHTIQYLQKQKAHLRNEERVPQVKPEDLEKFQSLQARIEELLKEREIYKYQLKKRQKLLDKFSEAVKKLESAKTRMEYYRTALIPPYSLSNGINFAEYLVVAESIEQLTINNIRKQHIDVMLSNLKEREQGILKMRFGLADGKEYTLEEIGQTLNLTRERIRQIESRILTNLQKSSSLIHARDYIEDQFLEERFTTIKARLHQALYAAIQETENLNYLLQKDFKQESLEQIDSLIEKYVEYARPGRRGHSRMQSRVSLFQQILKDIGSPVHYSIIHEKALEKLPANLHFPKNRAYSTLFYNEKYFRPYGQGAFGLSEWKSIHAIEMKQQIFDYCPQPLLPENAHAGAFFDSIIIGRNLLKEKSFTAEQFWNEMLTWANQSETSIHATQAVFDAWYAVDLLEKIDYAFSRHQPLKLTLPEANLTELRYHCLNALCQRVLKMPELLLTLTVIAYPTHKNIQKALFGSEHQGFDVSTRLQILMALGAVQQSNDEWRLTDIGRKTLEKNPAENLPDFSEIDSIEEDMEEDLFEDDDWFTGFIGIGMQNSNTRLDFVASLTVCPSDIRKIREHVVLSGTKLNPLRYTLITPLFVSPESLGMTRMLAEEGNNVFFDSGGYYVQIGRLKYEELYMPLLEAYKANPWATAYTLPDHVPTSQDTPDVVAQKVRDTITYSTIFFQELPDELKSRAMPVVQGHTIRQVDDCLETYIKLGVKRIGFGSFGTSGQSNEVNLATNSAVELAKHVVEVGHSYGMKVHMFGLGAPPLVAMLKGIGADSFDSSSWLKAAGFGMISFPFLRFHNISHSNTFSELQQGMSFKKFQEWKTLSKHECGLCQDVLKLQKYKMYRAVHNLIALTESVEMINDGNVEEIHRIYANGSIKYRKESYKWLQVP